MPELLGVAALRLRGRRQGCGSPERTFHRLIWDASRQVRTIAILTNLLELPVTFSYFKSLAPGDMERSVREHAALADALEARDPEWAQRLMEAHIHGGKQLFLERAMPDSARKLTPRASRI